MNPSDTPKIFAASDLDDLELLVKQQIDDSANCCQIQVQNCLDLIWEKAEVALASLSQRIVSDHLSAEDPAGLPYYHPLHWFKSQLEFKHQGRLDLPQYEAALASIQDLLNQIQPEITTALAHQQDIITETLDRHVENLRHSLAPVVQPRLPDPRVILTEYINSAVPLPRLQLREVERFGFFVGGQRFNPSTVIETTTKTVNPWYLMGVVQKQLPSYQITHDHLQIVIKESLDRSFQNIKTRITSYIKEDLHIQIQQLLKSVG